MHLHCNAESALTLAPSFMACALFLKMTQHGFVPVMFLSSVIRKNTPLCSPAIQKQVKQNQILLPPLCLVHLQPSRQSLYKPHYFPTLCRRKHSTRKCVEWLACACAHSWGLPVFFLSFIAPWFVTSECEWRSDLIIHCVISLLAFNVLPFIRSKNSEPIFGASWRLVMKKKQKKEARFFLSSKWLWSIQGPQFSSHLHPPFLLWVLLGLLQQAGWNSVSIFVDSLGCGHRTWLLAVSMSSSLMSSLIFFNY